MTLTAGTVAVSHGEMRREEGVSRDASRVS